MQYFMLEGDGSGLPPGLKGEIARAAFLNLKKIAHPAATMIPAIKIAIRAWVATRA